MSNRKRSIKKIVRADRIFMGMPVRDAEQSILVQPIREDIDKAVRGDPENCAYARCVKRMLKSSVVFVYHTVAYIEVLDSKGERVLERYFIKNGTRDYLETFDGGSSKVEPAGFSLKAPPISQTLDYKAAIRKRQVRAGLYARWQDNRKEKLLIEKKTGKKLIRRRVIAKRTVGSFRDGTGCVKFIGTHEGRLAKHEL